MVGKGRALLVSGVLAVASFIPLATAGAPAVHAAPSLKRHVSLNCEYSAICPDVADSESAFGSDEYVGHDEPSLIFYSNQAGSGNQMRYQVTLPRDPGPGTPTQPGKAYNFELHPTFWFGMALCDTESYPEQVSTCTPDSDSNIVDPATSPNHPGTAFLELQFYPPGWVPWPVWAVAPGATTCTPTQWCAAMNVFSLLQDPVNGTTQNATCASRVGVETWNFAFVTKNGVSQAAANPIDSTLASFTPDTHRDLLMNSGDRIQVTLHDTPNGVQAQLLDSRTHQSGSMTASPANGFAHIEYDPSGTSCNALPYAFHPMYSTASEQTRVIWAAHSYNVAFSDEIGHFEFCNGQNVPASQFGLDSSGNPITCPAGNTEGTGNDQEPTDGDDDFCFPASESLLVKVQGCTDTNTGFDGVAYQKVWPDGNTRLHPTPVQFTSALTGSHYDTAYPRTAFEADLPRIEFNTCNRTTGAGCTLIPTTDDGQPAAFYPFFSTTHAGHGPGPGHGRPGPPPPHHEGCIWQFGDDTPGITSDFGKNNQYGSLLQLTYLSGSGTVQRYNDFRDVISNPC